MLVISTVPNRWLNRCRRLVVLLSLSSVLVSCSLQQRRQAIEFNPPDSQPSGRQIQSKAQDWSLYSIKGGKSPLAIADTAGALQLTSDSSVGIYWLDLSIDVSREPLLAWEWKVSRIFADSSPFLSQTDNFPARVLIGFDASWKDADPMALSFKRKVEAATGRSPPSRAICYTFGGALSGHEAIDGSFGSGRVAVINLRPSTSGTGVWFDQIRDLQRDYEAVFQLRCPRVSMIGIACDTHLVGGWAQAWFRNFTVYQAPARSSIEAGPSPQALGLPSWRMAILILSSAVAAVVAAVWFKRRKHNPKRS